MTSPLMGDNGYKVNRSEHVPLEIRRKNFEEKSNSDDFEAILIATIIHLEYDAFSSDYDVVLQASLELNALGRKFGSQRFISEAHAERWTIWL